MKNPERDEKEKIKGIVKECISSGYTPISETTCKITFDEEKRLNK